MSMLFQRLVCRQNTLIRQTLPRGMLQPNLFRNSLSGPHAPFKHPKTLDLTIPHKQGDYHGRSCALSRCPTGLKCFEKPKRDIQERLDDDLNGLAENVNERELTIFSYELNRRLEGMQENLARGEASLNSLKRGTKILLAFLSVNLLLFAACYKFMYEQIVLLHKQLDEQGEKLDLIKENIAILNEMCNRRW
ncbi:hypothetical protein M422DRAFT_51699 [Sphaerobolus stellatus SS14]|uniref:Uncharacterized protein n=1 Tax=Sphaerobolus stellatus (strain SS14) TaxID=990650 RepID=A0A0C9TX12_SPHS4|nr:hypothetical protein M422DRAFT_51699 [Sphaerobolus stellatus SS14]